MFVVEWEGDPPPDKAEWLAILRDVFLGASGSYRIRLRRGPAGWRFDIDHRETGSHQPAVVANSPDSIRYSVFHALCEGGKPVDPNWRA